MESMEYGKIPPQAVEIEEAVLGVILLDTGVMDDVFMILDSPEYFYRESHQVIYGAILDLYKNDRSIDILTVIEKLRSIEKLEVVGGAMYVAGLSSRVASGLHVREHSQIVKQQAIKREVIRVSNEMMNMAYDETVDVVDLIDYSGNMLEKTSEALYGGSVFKPIIHYVEKALNDLEERQKIARSGKIAGVPTPIVQLNKATDGWHGGELTVIAARPSMGKTAVALAAVKRAAEEGVPVNVFSLEMAGERLVDRWLSGMSGVNPGNYRSGKITVDDWDKIESVSGQLTRLPIYIDDNPSPTMDYIRSRARVNKRKGRCGMVVIDYIQLVNIPSAFGKNREQEVASLSRKAKLLAMELNIPVILLAQLNRSCEIRGGDKRPILADLRESGAIEQDADNVMLLYRAERYGFLVDEDGNSNKGKGEIIIAKQRNGATGLVHFGYNESMTVIHDFSDDVHPVSPTMEEAARIAGESVDRMIKQNQDDDIQTNSGF